VGNAYNVPTFAVLKSPEDVQEYEFPASCCIKPTHGCGQVILRHADVGIDINEIQSWFDANQYDNGRERNYRYLRPKVIVEALVFDQAGADDYKIFCYNGRAKAIQLNSSRFSQHTLNLFDTKWQDLNISMNAVRSDEVIKKPANLSEMLEVAEKLSVEFDGLVRIDLYSNGDECRVGEITNVSNNAQGRFSTSTAEASFSKLLFT
jgi:hypothetical protein